MTYPFENVTVGEVLMQLNPKENDIIMIYRIVDGAPVLKLKQKYIDFINDPVGLYLPGFVKDFIVKKRPKTELVNDCPDKNVIIFYI